MFSITMHLVYIAVLSALTLVLAYQGLTLAYTLPVQALIYCLAALGTGTLFGLMLRRWIKLDVLWSRAIRILVPDQTKGDIQNTVRNSLNNVLSKKVFRNEMKQSLNRDGVFTFFMENDIPLIQLDIVLPDSWDNHNYLRSALGWIATCMPTTVVCQALERKKTRLVFRFAHRDLERRDAQGLRDAMLEWKQNIQSVLVFHLNKCTVKDIDYVPPKITRPHAIVSVPRILKSAFDESILLNEEQVCLHIGFNGSKYYTYFENDSTPQMHSRREYPSWAALWSVWQHMKEVQAAFQKPTYLSSGSAPTPTQAF